MFVLVRIFWLSQSQKLSRGQQFQSFLFSSAKPFFIILSPISSGNLSSRQFITIELLFQSMRSRSRKSKKKLRLCLFLFIRSCDKIFRFFLRLCVWMKNLPISIMKNVRQLMPWGWDGKLFFLLVDGEKKNAFNLNAFCIWSGQKILRKN